MELHKSKVEICCGKSNLIYQINDCVDESWIPFLEQNNFTILKPYLAAGILYAENKDVTVTATLGSNRINVKCRSSQCHEGTVGFEALLISK